MKKLLPIIVAVAAASSCAAETALPPSSNTRVVKMHSSTTSSLERSILNQLNQIRATQGGQPLVLDPALSQAALGHSESMAHGRVRLGAQGTDLQKAARGVTSSADMVACFSSKGDEPAAKFVSYWTETEGRKKLVTSATPKCGLGLARGADGLTYATLLLTGTASSNSLNTPFVKKAR